MKNSRPLIFVHSFLFAFFTSILLIQSPGWTADDGVYDIVIYGGSSAGIIAGIQAKKMGKSVVVVEATDRLGGLTTGGLGQTDIGNKQVIGGLSREFYARVEKHYANSDAWKWQKKEGYRDSGQSRTKVGEETMWTFEPSAALKIYEDWIEEVGLEIVKNEPLDREADIVMEGNRIVGFVTTKGRTFKGKMFIDATYEGDLMAAAGVSYTVGREAVAKYNESLNGVQTKQDKYHNFESRVDPYKIAGDKSSGLLPFLDPDGPGEEGSGDHRVQAYCFRMCLTDHPENRIPFAKPEGYVEEWYELLLRNCEAGMKATPWINSSMPNRKTDTNNRLGFSTDFIGQNYDYPEASDEERQVIVARHRLYQQGLMWTLANHPRVSSAIRKDVSRWGTCKDEFAADNGWQAQLYIREARRMVGAFVMTQNHCQQRNVDPITDSIGMGAYTMDSHHTQRYVTAEGFARNEGDVQVGGFPPYPIAYRSIIPKQSEANNLFVPICLSASHMAFGSIRMEPVFMVMGQSAATAASLSIDEAVDPADLDYKKLGDRLAADGQVLFHSGGGGAGGGKRTPLAELDGIVVDDTQAKLTGPWKASILSSGIHKGYLHDEEGKVGEASAVFTATLPEAEKYEVQVAYTPNGNRASNIQMVIEHAAGKTEATVDQKISPSIDGLFHPLGTFKFGKTGSVTISNKDADGFVVIDAVRWVPVKQ